MEPNPLQYQAENELRANFIKRVNDKCKKNFGPPEWLEQMESPFKWLLSLEVQLFINCSVPDKLQDYKNQGADYGFEKFTLLLSIVFLRIITTNDDSSDDLSVEQDDNDDTKETITNDETKNLSANKSSSDELSSLGNNSNELPTNFYEFDPELAYTKCKEALDEMVANERDVTYNQIGPALTHVLQSTRAHMLYLNGNITESKEMAKNIQSVTDMSKENLAGIEGIKAKFILSLYQDVTVALEASMKAVELDPSFGQWPYLTGKITRRLRRENKKEICEEELKYFEKAVELERNPKFLVFLAQAYQEMALSIIQKKNVMESLTTEEMYFKAACLFRECWRLKNDSAPISRRVGNGMMKMKYGLIDLSLTKQALLKAVELSPCSVTYHALGKFYLIHKHDEKKAIEYFTKIEAYYGNGEIIRYNLLKNSNYDAFQEIKELIEYAPHNAGPLKQNVIYCDAGWYYLYFQNDLFMSTRLFWRVLKKNYNSLNVLQFRSYAFCVNRPLNMLEILINEIMLLKLESTVLLEKEQAEMMFLEQFSEKVLEKHSMLREMNPNPDMLSAAKIKAAKDIELAKKHFTKNINKKKTVPVSNWRQKESGNMSRESYEGNRGVVSGGKYERRPEQQTNTAPVSSWRQKESGNMSRESYDRNQGVVSGGKYERRQEQQANTAPVSNWRQKESGNMIRESYEGSRGVVSGGKYERRPEQQAKSGTVSKWRQKEGGNMTRESYEGNRGVMSKGNYEGRQEFISRERYVRSEGNVRKCSERSQDQAIRERYDGNVSRESYNGGNGIEKIGKHTRNQECMSRESNLGNQISGGKAAMREDKANPPE